MRIPNEMQFKGHETVRRADSALTLLAKTKNGWCRGAALLIRSSRWQAVIAAGGVAALCLAPGARAERLGWGSTADADQSPAECRTDCTIGKQSIVTLSGVNTTTIGALVVRDGRERYVATSGDFRQLLIFDARGRLLDSPRPTYGRLVSLFVDSVGTVQTYDSRSGSLLAFDPNYQVKTKTELPHRPALALGGGSFVVASQIPTPELVGHPLHVMSKDGSILRSFGGDGGPFYSENTLKNLRAVCLNPDGTIWSIAPGGRLLERWDTSTGHRLAQVTVKSTWFRESSKPAPPGQVANPLILTIWAEDDLVWILYRVPDPQWNPKLTPPEEPAGRGDTENRRSDWVLEAVRSDTGGVVAMKSFDRILLRRDGSFAIASEAASSNRAGGVELWRPVVVRKEKRP
jgi:hypothetical protein